MDNLKLSDLIIMSDIDGTLLENPGWVHKRNIDAIRRFVDIGGRFALATGRAMSFVSRLVEEMPVNFPCVLCNGCIIYDYGTGKVLLKKYMPDTVLSHLQSILKRFPKIGILLVDDEHYNDVDGNYISTFADNPISNIIRPIKFDAIEGPYYKVVFITTHQDDQAFAGYVNDINFTDVRLITTAKHMYEIIPSCVSKGSALEYLTKKGMADREQFVAIGDYYNDKEMLSYAGISATMASSPEDLKRLCRYIVCECRDGSLADLIDKLERDFT